MPAEEHHYRQAGVSAIEVIVVIIALAVVITLLLPSLTRARDNARGLTCQDRLRQLGEAANHYADDFNGRFFYHWPNFTTAPDGEPGTVAGWWYDSERAGKYITNADSRAKWFSPVANPAKENYTHLRELTGGVMVCPRYLEEDNRDEGPVPPRSYAMNFWASGVDFTPHVKKTTGQGNGITYTREADELDRLLLFTEAVIERGRGGAARVRQEDWFGVWGPPFERFAGARTLEGILTRPVGPGPMPNWYPDYNRHTPQNPENWPAPIGQANTVFADGHVAAIKSGDLYDVGARRSTYEVLWSPIDQKVDEEYINRGHRDPNRPIDLPPEQLAPAAPLQP